MNRESPMDPLQYIPLMDIGPGSQPEEDEVLEYISMPQGMYTHSLPMLPEPEELDKQPGARQALQILLEHLRLAVRGEPAPGLDLSGYSVGDRALLDQLLGEGEVSIRVGEQPAQRIQESIFAGIWRTVGEHEDRVDVAAAPAHLRASARVGTRPLPFDLPAELPAGVMNAPSILTEIEDQAQHWQSGHPAHVINLTLLPLSEQDVGFLDQCLGSGPVLALTRGYGNCRISSTQVANVWRLTYFNSQDAMILDTIEITDLPEVICAAPEDLSDSLERFEDVIQWFEGQ